MDYLSAYSSLLIFKGRINHAGAQISPVTRYVIRIRVEKAIADSALNPIQEKRVIKPISLIPIPYIDIGIKAARVAIEKHATRFKKEILISRDNANKYGSINLISVPIILRLTIENNWE